MGTGGVPISPLTQDPLMVISLLVWYMYETEVWRAFRIFYPTFAKPVRVDIRLRGIWSGFSRYRGESNKALSIPVNTLHDMISTGGEPNASTS